MGWSMPSSCHDSIYRCENWSTVECRRFKSLSILLIQLLTTDCKFLIPRLGMKSVSIMQTRRKVNVSR